MSNVTLSKSQNSVSPLAFVRESWRQAVIYLGFAVLFIIFSITLRDQGFLDINNLLNIVRQTAIIAIMAVAMTFVLAAGEIDLSVGSLAGLSSVVTAMVLRDYGLVAGIFAGLCIGSLAGVVNGFLTTKIGIPSFLVTLAAMGICTGTSMWISHTASIPILNQTYAFLFGGGDIGPFPILLFWMAIIGVTGHVALKHNTFGRRVLATGGNETAAQYSGINTKVIKARVMLMSSMAAGLAGMLYAGRLQSGRFQFGEGDEMSVIAAAVLGGTGLAGGHGTVVGSIIGAIMIGMINNGLTLHGLEYSQQLVARGAIIVLAVALSKKN
ncbi:ribose transport system permease protein [Cohaesibacter marisflavi]|uniref:Ribose transport system permease protein n=1 Tax=Cohaesibacter marisflavi TaxID=655353 RepID=A0A1I5ME83_9HYPH|nr:ABC transporter permease [Cohaesibacter marisflavi]SFP07829.1 ribose transport system permease protein [Cohaesibacter marisflavi]